MCNCGTLVKFATFNLGVGAAPSPPQNQRGKVGGASLPHLFMWAFGREGAASTPKIDDSRARI